MDIIQGLYEHQSCANNDDAYINAYKKPIVELLEVEKDIIRESDPSDFKIIFVIKGLLLISYGRNMDKELGSGHMFLIPPNSKYTIHAIENAEIVIFRLQNKKVVLCERIGLEGLYRLNKAPKEDFNPLKIKSPISHLIRDVLISLSDGLNCRYYLELKIKEFFYLIGAYYSKLELASFLFPLLSDDTSFSLFVYNNYRKVKTAQDLAALSNYSHSGFIKRFKKTFGMPAYQWMKMQKANCILHDIHYSKKTLKEICDEYDFSTLSQFNNFCKSNFGYPPSQLRKIKQMI